jgi:hypothetical protein
MSNPPINITHISSTLYLTEHKDGFWLWDDTLEMNIALREKTKEDALYQALTFYQSRSNQLEEKYDNLHNAVDKFLIGLATVNDDEFGIVSMND